MISISDGDGPNGQRAIVTGASGFVGRALARHLRALGYQVLGVVRRPSANTERGQCQVLDLHDSPALIALLAHWRPHVVFHLAGVTVPTEPGQFDADIVTTETLLKAAALMRSVPRIMLFGSAAEYGPLPCSELPGGEATPCRPLTSYGIAKLAQTQLGLRAAAKGQPVTVARLFNIIGPGMGEHLALGRFVRCIAQLGPEGGILRTGSLDGQRDFVALSDLVVVLEKLARNDASLSRVIPICSGKATRMRVLVDELVRVSGRHVVVEYDGKRHGVNPVDVMVGDPQPLIELGLPVPQSDIAACVAQVWHAAQARVLSPAETM